MADGVPSMNLDFLNQIDEVRVTLSIEGQRAGDWTVVSFSGNDALSDLGEYLITVSSTPGVAAGLDDALGRRGTLALERVGDEAALHVVRGVVEEVLPSGKSVGESLRHTLIRMVPVLHELRHTKSARVFQSMTVVEIATELLMLWQIDLDARLYPSPLKREYCTQLNESDYDFLRRIFSEEGVHFHVDHQKDTSTLVLVNDSRGYVAVDGKARLPYRDEGGAVTVEHVMALRRERRVREGSAAYRDYNFLKPTSDMLASAMTDAPDAPGTMMARQFYEYPGHYNNPESENVGVPDEVQLATQQGKVRARMRLEALRSQALTFSGVSTSLRLRVGRRFEIGDHADAPFNGTYLVTAIHVRGAKSSEAVIMDRGDRTSAARIEIGFSAVQADTPIRPRVVAKPPAHLRTARVVGPKADEPNVDAYGRVRIQFAWDREGQHNDTSSCWVRMATPLAHRGQERTPRIASGPKFSSIFWMATSIDRS